MNSDAADSVVSYDSLVNVTSLPELDVVAVKQKMSLSDLPVSASSIGMVESERLGIADIKQISDIVPNFYIPDYGSRITSSIYVRGIGARMDQPAVGLTVDNLTVMNKDAYDFDITDIAEIEMLRGPQSSLFGRNTMMGIINIRTLSPFSFQGWRVMAQGEIPAAARASIGWYGLPKKDLGIGISLGYDFRKGRYRNLYNGSNVDRQQSGSLRFKLESKIGKIHLTNTLSSSILRQGGYPYVYIPSGEINYNDTCFYRRFLISDALALDWTVRNIRFTSVTSVQYIDDNMTLDQDFLPLPYFTLTQKKKEISITEDFMVGGVSASGRYSWLSGMFLFYRHNDMHAPVKFKDEGIASLIVSHRNEANKRYPIRWDSDSFLLNSDFTLPSFGAALYHESRYNTDQWRFSAGIRLDYERVSMNYHSYCNTGYDILDNPSRELPPSPDLPVLRHAVISIDDQGNLHRQYLTVLPKITALYTLPDEYGNAYVSLGRGYKAGGFNTQMFSDVLQQSLMNKMGMGASYDVDDIVGYRPEKCWSYEVGSHINLLNKSITLDASLFYIDVTDQQLTRFPPGATTGRLMTNAGKTRSFGGELSILWHPLRSLSANMAYGYTNAKFREFSDGLNNYKGKYLPYAPGNTLWIQTVYTLADPLLKSNRLVFDVNMRGTGRIFWNEANTRSQNFYALLGASVSLQNPSWEVQIWGRNLTNTQYDTFYFLSMGNEFVQRANGISAGLTLRLSI
ncbi:MAG: TonB-dependent receptor [Muribaculum sp.]|nr:TonB-dependent receptor [Muribaculum sp.]